MINKLRLILISSAILILTAVSAIAQTTRAYVADSGDDTNLCSKPAPCRTVAKALGVVDAGGEVIITESGDYEPFAVTKSATIAAAPGVDAEILSTGTVAISITVGQPQIVDSITIRNLKVKNISSMSNTAGIYNVAGTNLYVENCTFLGFESGIAEGNKPGKLFVHDSTFRNNVSGISLNTTIGEGVQVAVIDNCKIEHNEIGVYVASKSYATIRNSVISDNASFGVAVNSLKSGLRAEAVIDNSQLTGNTDGIKVSGTGVSIARLSRSTITQNILYGVVIGANSFVYSFQNNVINGNPTDVSGNLTIVATK